MPSVTQKCVKAAAARRERKVRHGGFGEGVAQLNPLVAALRNGKPSVVKEEGENQYYLNLAQQHSCAVEM